jgi:hypothetical protein
MSSNFSSPAPAPQAASAPTGAAPRAVSAAFWLFMLAVLAHVVGLVITIAQFPAAEQRARTQLSHAGTATHGIDVNGVLNASLVVGIVVGVLYIVAFIVFDIFMRRGAKWARIVLLIITVLSISGVVAAYGAGAVGVIAAVIAVILTFLPASNDYFRAVKERRRALQPTVRGRG